MKEKKIYPIRFDGSDGDFLYFSTPSWSTRGVRYDINICKETGIVICSCLDSSYRHKTPGLVKFLSRDGAQSSCKHQNLLRESYAELLAVPA